MLLISRWFHQWASPPHFFRLAGRLSPWFAALAVACGLAGLCGGLVWAPPDYQQGEAYRIIYIHVPSAYLGLMGYTLMAAAAAIGFVWRIKLAHVITVSTAPLGASFTFLALATGALWGKPMWGTYWQWGDARLVSMLLLMFLYLGYMALHAAYDERDKGDRVSAILAIVGVVNVPIIHYSVEWWATLHQGPTIAKLADPSISASMLVPLLAMIAAFTFAFAWLLMQHARSELLARERDKSWVRELAAA